MGGLSQIIKALPPEKEMEMKALSLPTGIHSKKKFVKKLKNIASDAFVLKSKKSESVELTDPFGDGHDDEDDDDDGIIDALHSMDLNGTSFIEKENVNVVKVPGITNDNSVMLWSTRNN